MAVTLSNPLGRVHIYEEALSAAAGFYARECRGVAGVAARSVPDGIAELLGLENIHRGVQIQVTEGQLVVSLFVIVEYGVNIFQVARGVMERVKYGLEHLSGLSVDRIHVHIQGVRVPSPRPRRPREALGRRG